MGPQTIGLHQTQGIALGGMPEATARRETPMNGFPKHYLFFAGLLAALSLLAVACGGDDEETDTGASPTATEEAGGGGELQTDFGVTDTQIVLGLTIVQSGNLAAVYQPVAPSMTAYFAKVNEEDGGVCDRDIVLKVEDDQYSPAAGLEKARKLAEQDEVAAFVGNLGTPPVTGQVDYINEQEIPHLFVSTGAAKWGDVATYPWTIGFIPDYISEGKILATYVNDNFADQTAAILYQNDDFGKNGQQGFKDTFAGQVVAEEPYESSATDINSQLANLRSADPDIVYLYSTPAFTARVFAYMKANNWDPQVVQSYVNSPSTLAALVGGDAGAAAGFETIGGTISTNYLLDPVADKDSGPLVEHTRIMAQFGGPPVGNLSIYGQSLAELVVETLSIACDNGDMTRAGLLEAAESVQGFSPSLVPEGIEINLGPEDHFAIQALIPTQIEATGVLTPLGDPISVEE